MKTFNLRAITLAVMSLAGAAQTALAAVPDSGHPAVQRALSHLGSSALDAAKGTGSDSFVPSDLIIDANGSEHVRFKRAFRGLPVIGGDLVVHSRPDGSFDSLSQTLDSRLALSIKPTLSEAQAVSLALHRFAYDDGAVLSKGLAVYARGSLPQLVWDIVVTGTAANGVPSRTHMIVDAHSKKLLDRWDEIVSIEGEFAAKKGGTDDIGSGKSLYYGTVVVHDVTNKKGKKFTLKDLTRGGHYVVDMKSTQTTETQYKAKDNVWGDGTMADSETVAADAAYGQNMTWDFYKNVLGRNGIADDGKGAHSRVHFGSKVDNAYWDDGCFCMMYGDGNVSFKPLVALDVAGHEMTHGVTSRTAGLIYSGESGGLNEGSSDVLGTMVEYYANNPGDPGDYTIGEMITLKQGTVLRYMYQPSKDGRSSDCWYSGVGSLDPHFSSGVTNHFYYLLAEGSAPADGPASKTCKAGDTRTATGNALLTGIGRDKAERIWYRALSTYMTSSETYAKARTDTIKAADDLYGAGSAESAAVAAAWTAINRP